MQAPAPENPSNPKPKPDFLKLAMHTFRQQHKDQPEVLEAVKEFEQLVFTNWQRVPVLNLQDELRQSRQHIQELERDVSSQKEQLQKFLEELENKQLLPRMLGGRWRKLQQELGKYREHEKNRLQTWLNGFEQNKKTDVLVLQLQRRLTKLKGQSIVVEKMPPIQPLPDPSDGNA